MPALDQIPLALPGAFTLTKDATKERDFYFTTFTAVVSVAILVIQLLYKLAYPYNGKKGIDQHSRNISSIKRFQNHVLIIGGWKLFTFRLVRFAACVALAILSWVSIDKSSLQIGLSAYTLASIYVYTSLLAFVSIVTTPEWATVATGHLVPVLLVPWGVFLYRDVWPLATYTLIPADADEGWFIWAKVSLLTVAAVVVPLASPRRYIPVDPSEPMSEPNEEQTASWLSRSLFSYCDRTILKAYRQPHLTVDDLPVLADSEYTKNLIQRAFPHIDPLKNKNKHILYGLVFRIFWQEHIISALSLIVRVCGSLVAPLGINRLLNYLETGGEDATVRPWFWIIWIFLGPMISTLGFGAFFYYMLIIEIEGRSILTQLMFDHALRIRMKADASNSSESSAPTITDEEQSREHSVVESDEASTSGPSSDTASATADKKDKKVEETKDSSKGKGNLAGKINNLVTADFANIENGLNWPMLVFYAPVQIVLSLFMLYELLGWSVFPGIAVMILAAPLPGYLTKLMHGIQTEKMKRSDARVQSVTEAMNVIRMIKLFGWENKMSGVLGQKRSEELKTVRKMKMMELSNGIINYLIPVLTTIATFATYTLVMKKELTASLVFPALTIFSLIEEHFSGIFWILPNIIQAKVSLDRINDFLHNTELLDKFVDDPSNDSTSLTILNTEPEALDSIPEEAPIGIRNSSFTWTADEETDGSTTPGGRHRRHFKLKIEDEVFFKKGHINIIIGQTGSGKTSLLMALLGEMHHIPLSPNALVSLPREGGIAYHAQESWVLNETIKENILFGSPFDEERYQAVIEQCGLTHDLSLFEAGDLTEVGEKGITLSGGQKARITLARAVYSHADILLLDDVLAALDVHTAKWIVEKCLQGPLVQGRTVILVTHNIALTSPIAEYVIALGSDGRVLSQGSLSNVLAKDQKLSAELAKETKEIAEADKEIDEESPDELAKKVAGKLIVEEEVEMGHVGWTALKLLFANMGGRGGLFLYWFGFITTATLFRMSTVYQMFIVTMWSDEYSHHPASEVSVPYYMSLYSACVLATATLLFINYWIYVFGSIRATKTIHNLLVEKVFGTTLRWLDRTPASRIITRCTEDIQAIDTTVTEFFYHLVDLSLNMGLKFAAVMVMSPLFGGLGILLAIVGGTIGNIYMKAQLPIKRENSNAKAPVMGHFSAAMSGLVSIRAYGAEEKFRLESFKRIDRMSRTARIFFDLNRWIGVRTDALAWGFSAALAAYLTYGKSHVGSANTGFSLTMATGFSSLLLIWIRIFNLFETSGNSLERINQYLTIEQEPKPTSDGIPPAYWPASGDLRVENLSARYSADGPEVLHGISFHAKSGERIGIVGRTGSGKSSLTLALLRCILTEGDVYYDGLPTKDINLDVLRSNITIIPQVPELLSGTLRENLDPFSQYDDATLNDSLRAAGLFSLQSDTDEGKITLDTQIAGGGSNLSVGQRQILALARAIIRQSKLLILDEATSAIDYETDSIIQTSLRKELNKDVTLLTVAHRLQTIMDADKIMVLDSGRIAEFDKPSVLLKNEKGMLRALVDESGDKDKLYAMAAL
ncbi:multidrug resistance-associated ABC transporter [Abortiporus biennis]|nr:multidrug resistance-associated ABC transporter [Abortiporus biennis]